MMKIECFHCNMLQENCYVASDDTGQAVIIDCGAQTEAEFGAISRYIDQHQLAPRHLLFTHGHFDHVMGAAFVHQHYGLQPAIHAADERLYLSASEQMRQMLGATLPLRQPTVGQRLGDGDIISFGNHQLRVLHTPGHSRGGVVFHCAEEHVLFTGDTLFHMSVGRTDFEGGSWDELIDSLQRVIAVLPADTKIYPGHGPATLLADELRLNPYLR